MNVILIQDVEGVGFRGDSVSVAAGYARNFLIPRGMALLATAASMKVAAELNAAKDRKEAHERDAAQQRASNMGGLKVRLEVKAGEEGKLFGSVTSQDIADALGAQGVEIDKKDVILRVPLKQVGTYRVPVRVFRDIRPEVMVEIDWDVPPVKEKLAPVPKPRTDEDGAEGSEGNGAEGGDAPEASVAADTAEAGEGAERAEG